MISLCPQSWQGHALPGTKDWLRAARATLPKPGRPHAALCSAGKNVALWLKALFNNVFTLTKSELHVPTCWVSLITYKNEALKKKKLHLKSTIKCFQEVKIDKWPDLSYSFLPIECCVRINDKPVTIYSVVIFSHRYLDSDRINFKTFVFLAVYWPFWTS